MQIPSYTLMQFIIKYHGDYLIQPTFSLKKNEVTFERISRDINHAKRMSLKCVRALIKKHIQTWNKTYFIDNYEIQIVDI